MGAGSTVQGVPTILLFLGCVILGFPGVRAEIVFLLNAHCDVKDLWSS